MSSRWIVTLILCMMPLATVSINAITDSQNEEMYYQNQNYEAALEIYQSLFQKAPNSVALLYNLGNTQFKLGHYSQAILFYRKALTFQPYDRDIWDNLNLAREFVTDNVASEERFMTNLFGWVNYVSLNQSFYFFMITLAGLLVAMILFLTKRQRKEVVLNMIYILICINLFLGGVLMAKCVDYRADYAVVLSKKVAAHSGPSENLPTLFYIHEGHELEIIEKNNGWVEIRLSNGFRGWVKGMELGRI